MTTPANSPFLNGDRFVIDVSGAPAAHVVIGAFVLPDFGTADFTLPADLTTLEASAFEGVTDLRIVDARSCTAIGANVFTGTGLSQIRLPKDCLIDTGAFSGCWRVFVFAEAGGMTEAYCSDPAHANCTFVPVS